MSFKGFESLQRFMERDYYERGSEEPTEQSARERELEAMLAAANARIAELTKDLEYLRSGGMSAAVLTQRAEAAERKLATAIEKCCQIIEKSHDNKSITAWEVRKAFGLLPADAPHPASVGEYLRRADARHKALAQIEQPHAIDAAMQAEKAKP